MKTHTFLLLALLLSSCGGSEPEPAQTKSTPQMSAVPAKAPDEAAAIAAIQQINEAQKDYFFRNRSYALTYQELIDGRFLTEEPTVARTGYEIRLRPKPDVSGYSLVAVPSTAAATTRHFFSDQSGDIRAETGKDATAESPKISQ